MSRRCHPGPRMGAMTSLTVELDDDDAERLRLRAERLGVTPGELARRLLTEASGQDPFEFVGSFEADGLSAADADRFLQEHGFGTR